MRKSLVIAALSSLFAVEAIAQTSESIRDLRALAEAASTGQIPPEFAAKTQSLADFVAGRSVPLTVAQAARTTQPAPFYITAKAKTVTPVPIDCREVQRRFAQAKAYWQELLCVTRSILSMASAPCPDLRCIRIYVDRAEKLRDQIEATYPTTWDERSIELRRVWELSTLSPGQLWLRDPSQKLTVSQAKQSTMASTHFVAAHWHNINWFAPENIPSTTIEWTTDAVELVQQLSVTNYCIESTALRLWLTSELTWPSTAESGDPARVDLVIDF